MAKHTVTVIPGDGIGPEIMNAILPVIIATGVDIDWEFADAGESAIAGHGDPLPRATVASLRRNHVGIKGPTMTPAGGGHRSVNVRLREKLGMFACVRPIVPLPGVPALNDGAGIDLIIIRENLEDLYAGHEYVVSGSGILGPIPGSNARVVSIEQARRFSNITFSTGTAVALKVISPERTRKIVRFAFEYARTFGRKKITCVHKANILKQTDGLFLTIFREIAQEFGDVAADDVIIDAITMRLVQHPERFDVIVCPNLYGDILSDLCAGLVGGLGVAPGANIGDDCALFEATHGTAPDIAGKNLANPTALLLSAVMMLDYLDERTAADRLGQAIHGVLGRGTHLTPDLKPGSTCGTKEMAHAIADDVAALAKIPVEEDDEGMRIVR